MTTTTNTQRPFAALLAILVMTACWLPTLSTPARAEAGMALAATGSAPAVHPTPVVM